MGRALIARNHLPPTFPGRPGCVSSAPGLGCTLNTSPHIYWHPGQVQNFPHIAFRLPCTHNLITTGLCVQLADWPGYSNFTCSAASKNTHPTDFAARPHSGHAFMIQPSKMITVFLLPLVGVLLVYTAYAPFSPVMLCSHTLFDNGMSSRQPHASTNGTQRVQSMQFGAQNTNVISHTNHRVFRQQQQQQLHQQHIIEQQFVGQMEEEVGRWIECKSYHAICSRIRTHLHAHHHLITPACALAI
jgi:hypothetical protein